MALNVDLYTTNVINAIQHKKAAPESDSTIHILEDGTPISTLERPCQDVPEPLKGAMPEGRFWQDDTHQKPNVPHLRDFLAAEGRLAQDQALWIIKTGTKVLRTEPNLLPLQLPVTICGSIAGQYYDLLNIFTLGGDVPDTSYLFLGNYVNRGCFGIECVLLLWSLKICYPKNVALLRGIPECRSHSESHTFKTECEQKYSTEVYEACLESFSHLPLAAVLNDQYFCAYGGISEQLDVPAPLNWIFLMNRVKDTIADDSLMCDVILSGPSLSYDKKVTSEPEVQENTILDESSHYSYSAVRMFLLRHNLLGIIQSHDGSHGVQDSGYKFYRKTPENGFPSLIHVWSAPNFKDTYGNKAAMLRVTSETLNVKQFNAVPHPYYLPGYYLPGYRNAFNWSLPFLTEKITDMAMDILNHGLDEEVDEDTRSSLFSAPHSINYPEDDPSVELTRQYEKLGIVAIGRVRRKYEVAGTQPEAFNERASNSQLSPAMPSVLGQRQVRDWIKRSQTEAAVYETIEEEDDEYS
ncbi:serine/threonine protein phosphatase 2B catalytic subunit [Ophiobolus disseminans]|uniref:Serine/threonine protein phosphatase 2B catalytic subunit n=1 Tax=Ophiobolus disseminans TaxID=1469910 RepID=A0A6A6ZNP4_9PLEO|nr:serine/threonine protein phosphatase 2B catalytic subunit [Ophiobolus disseminans]